MDDVAGAAAEDGVELVFTLRRETPVAALLVADELLVAEVPAARTLVDVAADGSLISDLRRADFDLLGRDGRIQAADLGVLRDVDHSHRGPDPQAAVRMRHR